ncbi:MAG TPA: hypothetical protein VMT17_01960 [Anaeromyxobacteraceae bacterium]|nr:hypothetical protein [Anaeromyxobacteraceae bacterium]
MAPDGIGPHGVPQVEPIAPQAKGRAPRAGSADAGSRKRDPEGSQAERRERDEDAGPEVSDLATVVFELAEVLRESPRRFPELMERAAIAVDRAAEGFPEAHRRSIRDLAEALRRAGRAGLLPPLGALEAGSGAEGGAPGHVHSYARAQASAIGPSEARRLASLLRAAMRDAAG